MVALPALYMLDVRLTEREREVLHLVTLGHTDRQIAQRLIISTRTVNRHMCNIFNKLAVSSRAAAAAYAVRYDLV